MYERVVSVSEFLTEMEFHDGASEYPGQKKKQQKVLINIYTCPCASREK